MFVLPNITPLVEYIEIHKLIDKSGAIYWIIEKADKHDH